LDSPAIEIQAKPNRTIVTSDTTMTPGTANSFVTAAGGSTPSLPSLAWIEVIFLIWIAGTLFTVARWLRETLFASQITRQGDPIVDSE
jgi:hypothetical protein